VVHFNLLFSSTEMISVLIEFNYWIVCLLTTLNTFQEPAHHCHLSSYKLTFEEGGNIYPLSGIVSQLPFEKTGLKPFTVYTWKLVHNNGMIFMNTTRTLEDGKLQTFAYIVISMMILILCCIIQVVSFHVNCY
jgi:hypothetical protein